MSEGEVLICALLMFILSELSADDTSRKVWFYTGALAIVLLALKAVLKA